MIKLFKKIEEGEAWTNAIIGYRWVTYRDVDEGLLKSLRVSIYLRFFLIKIEIIKL